MTNAHAKMRKEFIWFGSVAALVLSFFRAEFLAAGSNIEFPELNREPNYTLVEYQNSMEAYWPLGPYAAFAKVIVYDMAYVDLGIDYCCIVRLYTLHFGQWVHI